MGVATEAITFTENVRCSLVWTAWNRNQRQSPECRQSVNMVGKRCLLLAVPMQESASNGGIFWRW